MFFSPVCFLPWRAAWPEVVNVSGQENREAWGHGCFFLRGLVVEGEELVGVEVDGAIAGVVRDEGDELSASSVLLYVNCVCSGWREERSRSG